MPMGSVQRRVSSFLNHPDNRGRWFDTRSISQEVYDEGWPKPVQMMRTRQALNALEERGDVVRFGRMAEWRTAKAPENEPPRLVKEVEKKLGKEAADLLRQVEPEYRRTGWKYNG